jgi:lipoprotein-anchoring transpeptidase ErfK/SrfK
MVLPAAKKFLVALFCLAIIVPHVTAQAADCTQVEAGDGCAHGLPIDQYNALLAQMNANPGPPVGQVPVDAAELRRYSLYQLDRSAVTVYDSPGGQPVTVENPGYAFVVPKSNTDGWVEIESGQWVSKSNLSGSRASGHAGRLLNGAAFPYPMAWVVAAAKPAKYPGGPSLRSTPTIPQYTPVYLYHSVQVGQWEWYLIGPGQWINQRGVARLVTVPPPGGASGRWVAVDLYEQVLTAYEGGTPVFATPISSGLRQWETPQGLFSVWAMLKTDAMNGSMGQPDQYSIPVVPYVMYFNGSVALHGAFWHNGFGYRHSHGCVNMSISDAKWLFGWGSTGMSVYVFSSR